MTTISSSTTTNTAYICSPDTTGTLVLQTGATPTTAMTIGSDQVVAFAKQPTGTFAGTGPAFSAYNTTTQALSAATNTLLIMNIKDFDTGGCFNNTGSPATLNGLTVPAYAFMPNVAGYYQINCLFTVAGPANSSGYTGGHLYKNGAAYREFATLAANNTNYVTAAVSALVYLNGSTDYVQWYGASSAAIASYISSQWTNISGSMVRSA